MPDQISKPPPSSESDLTLQCVKTGSRIVLPCVFLLVRVSSPAFPPSKVCSFLRSGIATTIAWSSISGSRGSVWHLHGCSLKSRLSRGRNGHRLRSQDWPASAVKHLCAARVVSAHLVEDRVDGQRAAMARAHCGALGRAMRSRSLLRHSL